MNGLTIYVPLCVGGSKEIAGIQMWCIPEKRDTNKICTHINMIILNT